tara:strand:- start:234 stop:359 length:126 start_codon:yes stop_codon:yes gene_type:complete
MKHGIKELKEPDISNGIIFMKIDSVKANNDNIKKLQNLDFQ